MCACRFIQFLLMLKMSMCVGGLVANQSVLLRSQELAILLFILTPPHIQCYSLPVIENLRTKFPSLQGRELVWSDGYI